MKHHRSKKYQKFVPKNVRECLDQNLVNIKGKYKRKGVDKA